jgi:shikimate dehydrogenase
MHNAAFANAGRNAVYIPFEVKDVKAFIKRMIHPRTRELNWDVRGLSVTAPHKSAVMDQLDWIDPSAHAIGVVNTIMVEGDALCGYNTDAQGFLQPLQRKFGDLTQAHCAIIGAGGAASAALWGLNQAGAKATVFARNAGKASALAEQFGADWQILDGASFEEFDVVVNATPLGTAHHLEDQTPALASQLRGARLAYDLVYNPEDTRFLREAREAGCETLGGLAMLVGQAREQFRLWIGESAPEDTMYEAARKGLMDSAPS